VATSTLLYCVGAVLAGAAALKLKSRLELSIAKHRSLAGHARMSRRLASFVPYYEYDERDFFAADGADDATAQRRHRAFSKLSVFYRTNFPKSAAATTQAATRISDLQFTARYRVPFQFSRYVREHLRGGSFLASSHGVTVTDLDGNDFYDLTGSYGVNVFGYDFYKECIAEGAARAQQLGPVLGAYHEAVNYNTRRLCDISHLDEVSFHMSGTEAVMQAVRLARYHTRRSHLVRFTGAYHGWWGDVQPGVGNPQRARDTYTLEEMSRAALHVLRTRKDIACVLVNPLQAMHPNGNAPGDSMLIDSGRKANFDREAYAKWLDEVREVCTARGIVLIFDEVFVGFRLALGGAQEYFGIRADMVTYGKTLGGGLPVGVLCGRAELMQRYREDLPSDICFARGTFNSHPYVMTAMQVFLERLETQPVRALYINLDQTWNERARLLNERLAAEGIPVALANLSTIWTVLYQRPSRYNWMLQFYLRAHGLALSWVGSGRLIFSLNFTDGDFESVAQRFVAAAREMHADGWWECPLSNKEIRRRVLKELLAVRFGRRRQMPQALRPVAPQEEADLS
jgi:glutamate-1-semialdehyde 2,1-aminomutase